MNKRLLSVEEVLPIFLVNTLWVFVDLTMNGDIVIAQDTLIILAHVHSDRKLRWDKKVNRAILRSII